MIRALPDLLSSTMMSRVTASLRSDLDRSALEAVTGRRSDITAATGGRNGQIHRAQQVLDQSRGVETRLALMTGRYSQAAAAFKSMRETVDGVGITALQAATSGDRTGIVTSAQDAVASIGAVIGVMNTRFDGRSIFGGDEASVSPLGTAEALLSDVELATAGATTTADRLAAIDAYFAPGGDFGNNFYTGGQNDAASVVLPSGSELPPIDRADSDGIRELLKGLTLIAESVKLPPVDIVDWVKQGTDLIRSAESSLTVSEAQVATSLNLIDRALELESDKQFVAEETIDRVIGRDAFEAASETQNLEIRLQAAYTLTSRIPTLSLTNFI